MLGSFDKEWRKIEDEYFSILKSRCSKDFLNFLDEKIVIFGISDLGFAYAKKISNEGNLNKLVAFCDNIKRGINEEYNLPIISPEDLVSNPRYIDTKIEKDTTYRYKIVAEYKILHSTRQTEEITIITPKYEKKYVEQLIGDEKIINEIGCHNDSLFLFGRKHKKINSFV